MVRRAFVLATGLLASCGGGHGSTDAAVDAPVVDRPGNELPGGLHVDFTVEGCPELDTSDGQVRCRGPAPLELTFYPVTSPSVAGYQWDFGDGPESSSEQTPTHVYRTPGSFSVLLRVVGADGVAEKRRDDFVVVNAAAAGESCDDDAQCAAGLMCQCQEGTKGCPPAFVRGFCTTGCPADCGADGV